MTDQPKIPDEVRKAATAAVMLLNQRKPEVNEQAEECITEAFRDFVRVPEGWQVVPKEPTHEMCLYGSLPMMPADIYRSMLGAAPQPQESKT